MSARLISQRAARQGCRVRAVASLTPFLTLRPGCHQAKQWQARSTENPALPQRQGFSSPLFRALSTSTPLQQPKQPTQQPQQQPSQQQEPPKPSAALPKASSLLPPSVKHENIYTLPNILTFSRLIAAPILGYTILHDQHALTLGIFAYAGITDALDGWIARKWNQKTVVGTVIDPMADKTLMTVLTVTLAAKGALPVWLAVIILGRDVGLAMSAIYYRWISLPPPKTFSRYWDFSLPSAEVRPTTISKYNTFLQLALMGLTTVAPVVPGVDMSWGLGIMQYVVAATTIWSGASYVYSKDAVKILTPGKGVNGKKL